MKPFKQFLMEKEYSEGQMKVVPESLPDVLYHATDSEKKLNSILKNGLRASKAMNTHGYAGQKSGVIYLAARPLTNSDNIKEFKFNIQIDISNPLFDKEKVYLDENRYNSDIHGPEKDISLMFQNHGNVYFEYHHNHIPPELLELHEQ